MISAGEVFVITLSKGEDIALSGTAGQILSIYDHADVKLIPAAKDILGTVKVADGTTTSQLLGIDSSGRITVNQAIAVVGSAFANDMPVVIDVAANTAALTVGSLPGKVFTQYSARLAVNNTFTVNAAGVSVQLIAIQVVTAGNASTVSVFDGTIPTALNFVNLLPTTAVTNTPTLLSFSTPAIANNSLKITTAGTGAAVLNVWVNYWA